MVVMCKYCKKEYSSYSSRSNHIKKFHIDIDLKKLTILEINEKNITQNITKKEIKKSEVSNDEMYECRKCNKKYKYFQGRWRHEKTCNNNKMELILKENEEMKKEMQQLKNLLQKSLKIHPKTLNKINNQLINQNCNNNNTIHNTINIVQLGNENLIDVLSEKQKLRILERQAMSLNDLIELIHISPQFKQFKNVCITNLQSSFGQKYDEKSKKFIAVNKNELLNEIVDCRMYDIEKFYDENKDKMIPHKANQIKKFIDRMNNDEDIMKGMKKEEIKLILYNNHENINNKEIIL
jgi:hypothetical protein